MLLNYAQTERLALPRRTNYASVRAQPHEQQEKNITLIQLNFEYVCVLNINLNHKLVVHPTY